MPDFDANDDSLRLSGSGKDEPIELPKLRPRFMPRARSLAYGQCFAARATRPDRLQPRLGTRRWRAMRRACPTLRAAAVPGTLPARRRRLWTTCHGRAPGSPS